MGGTILLVKVMSMLEYYFWTLIKVLTILLFVVMVIGAVLIWKYDSNFGRKIFYSSAILCSMLLYLIM